jgi:hypothetical protein
MKMPSGYPNAELKRPKISRTQEITIFSIKKAPAEHRGQVVSPRAGEAGGGAGWLSNVVVIAPFWERKGSSLNAPVPFHATGVLPI